MPESSQCCRTGWHRFLNVFQHLRTPSASVTLERHRLSHQLSPRAPSASLFDKEQTLFLVQPCLAVLCLDLVKKEQCTCVCAKITPVLLLSERNKREDGFFGKHSICPSFWKSECHQTFSVMWEAGSTRCVDSRTRQRYFLSWILGCVKL